MRPVFPGLFIAFFILVLASCGGKDKKSSSPDSNAAAKDTAQIEKNTGIITGPADSTLTPVRSFIEKDLDKWGKSFNGFNIDSFRYYQQTRFEDIDYEVSSDLKQFYDLYKASLSYSPDSSQFIDLYSYNLMLEKKGKKIIASADVDNSVTLYDLKANIWKRIAFSGPSQWVEEAIWVSPTAFILAGVGSNEDDKSEAFIMLGDTKTKTFRWFESNAIRPKSSKYEASGIAKLKIDEWE